MRIKCPKFKKDDGTECQIIVGIRERSMYCGDNIEHDVFVLDDVIYRHKRKRKEKYLEQELREYCRCNDYDEKLKIIQTEMIKFVGIEEYKKAMLYAWLLVKPKILEDE